MRGKRRACLKIEDPTWQGSVLVIQHGDWAVDAFLVIRRIEGYSVCRARSPGHAVRLLKALAKLPPMPVDQEAIVAMRQGAERPEGYLAWIALVREVIKAHQRT